MLILFYKRWQSTSTKISLKHWIGDIKTSAFAINVPSLFDLLAYFLILYISKLHWKLKLEWNVSGKKGIFGQIPVESRYQVRGHTFLRIYGLIFTTVDIGLIPLFLDGQIIFTHALCWYSNIMKIILCCKYKFLFGKKIVIIKRTAVPLLLNVVHPSQVPGYTWLWLLLPLHNFWPNMKHNMSMTYCKLKGEWVFASR